jgi:hypothetical protein
MAFTLTNKSLPSEADSKILDQMVSINQKRLDRIEAMYLPLRFVEARLWYLIQA